LEFWFSDHIKLPVKAFAEAVVMRAAKPVFEYLAARAELPAISESEHEKKNLLIRAKNKLEPDVIEYILNYKLTAPKMDA